MEEGRKSGGEPRVAIIQAVQTPLGFFVLVVLVVEVVLGVVAAMSPGTDRTLLIVAMVVLIFLLVLIVTVLAIKWPTALNPQHGTSRDQGSGLNLRIALDFEGVEPGTTLRLERTATCIIQNPRNPE